MEIYFDKPLIETFFLVQSIEHLLHRAYEPKRMGLKNYQKINYYILFEVCIA